MHRATPGAAHRYMFRTVGLGSSFGGNPLEQHIGVGAATRVSEVAVTWPTSGLVDRIRNIEVDHRYSPREGDGKLLGERRGERP